jgi:hypothetical protein
MKRIKFILPCALVLLALLFLLSQLLKNSVAAPRFVPATSQPVGPFGSENYDWHVDIPFRDSKTWIWTGLSISNRHSFLYDLDKRMVVGELFNGSPVFANYDQTKMLCYGPGSSFVSFKERLQILLKKLSFGKVNLAAALNRTETFWLLDLRNNSARSIGSFSQVVGSGSRWVPAPGFRYAYNLPSTLDPGAFFLCDLESGTKKWVNLPTDLRFSPSGWWDAHSLLLRDSHTNFVSFDVLTRQTKIILSAQSLPQFLRDNNIVAENKVIVTSRNWNGQDYDHYFSFDRIGGIDTNTTFLAKLERTNSSLQLLYRGFQFKWLGHLDASATHYLFVGENGRPGQGGNGGAILRDLVHNTDQIVVPPDNSGQYSLARLYSNTVIYSRNRVLWRVNLNDTNATRLLPPYTTNTSPP